MNNAKVLIVGMGKLGTALALQLKQHGINAIGIRRDIHLIPQGIDKLAMDLSKIETLKSIQKQWDVVIYILAASTFNEAAYQTAYVDNLNNLLSVIDISENGRLIFISSSSVYGQNDGSWVDETSPTEPRSFNGQIMLEGEKLALQTNCATIVRFSGIYGAGRSRVINRVMKKTVAPLNPLIYSNRINEMDCVGVLKFLVMYALSNRKLDTIYIGSDCEPTPLAVIQRWLALQLGINDNELVEQPNNKRLAGSKRLSNQHLIKLGYQFIYPNYRLGYRTLLNG